jgi:hypothetical protein
MTPQSITSEIPCKSSRMLVPRGTEGIAIEAWRHGEKEIELIN